MCKSRRACRVRRSARGGRVRLPAGRRAELGGGEASQLDGERLDRWQASRAGTNVPPAISKRQSPPMSRPGGLSTPQGSTARLGGVLNNLGRGEQAIPLIRQALASLQGPDRPSRGCRGPSGKARGDILIFSGPTPTRRPGTIDGGAHAGLSITSSPKPLASAPRFEGNSSEWSPARCEGGPWRSSERSVLRLPAQRHRSRGNAGGELNLADPLHDPRPSRCRRARPGLARSCPAPGTAGRRLWRRATNVRPHDGRAPRRNVRLGTELLQAGGTKCPGAEHIDFARLSRSTSRRGWVAREHVLAAAPGRRDDVQDKAMYAAALRGTPRRRQRASRSRDCSGRRRRGDNRGLGIAHEAVRLAFPLALDAAIDLGDVEDADRLVETLAAHPRGEVPPFLRAQVTRANTLVADGTR